MFKEKKINENRVKKDFFKKKPVAISEVFFNSEFYFDNYYTEDLNEAKEVRLPEINEVGFITSHKNLSPLDFFNNETELFIFCSRINKKELTKVLSRNLFGISASSRVLEINPDIFKNSEIKCKLKISNNHAKIYAFSKEEKKYVLSGSGNPSINARNEFYIIYQNEDVYESLRKYFIDA